MPIEEEELARDREVIEAATPGPWSVTYVDDELYMNAIVIARESGTGELVDHTNNIAIVLLQEPRYADVDDGRWDENAEFIARARERWPLLANEVASLGERVASLERENSALRAKLAAIGG